MKVLSEQLPHGLPEPFGSVLFPKSTAYENPLIQPGHCTGIAEVMGSNPVQAGFFFQAFFFPQFVFSFFVVVVLTFFCVHSCVGLLFITS